VYYNSGILSSMDAVKWKEQKRAWATRPEAFLQGLGKAGTAAMGVAAAGDVVPHGTCAMMAHSDAANAMLQSVL
jgi:hypothetical protein